MRARTLDPGLLDLDHLGRHTFGDRALASELLNLFARQCRQLVPLIVAAGPADERMQAAHALKGSARAVGAWRLAALADAAEMLLEQGEPDALAALGEALSEAAQATQAAIGRQRDRPRTGTRPSRGAA